MKKSGKIIALLMSAAMIMGFFSCSAEDDSTSKSALEIAASNLSVVSETAGDEPIDLPLFASGGAKETVTVTWVSSDNSVIDPYSFLDEYVQAAVTPKTGTGFDTVTLTATLTDSKGNKATRAFKVKVYQSSAAVSDSKILKMASDRLASILVAPGLAWSETAFNGKISVNGEDVTVTFEESDDVKYIGTSALQSGEYKAVKIQGSDDGLYNYYIGIFRTLYAKNVNVKAHLAYNGQTLDKTYKLNLPAITKITDDQGDIVYDYDAGKKIMTVTEYHDDGSIDYIRKYSFVPDYEAGTAVISFMSMCEPAVTGNKFMNLKDYAHAEMEGYKLLINTFEAFEAKAAESKQTWNDVLNVAKLVLPVLADVENPTTAQVYAFLGQGLWGTKEELEDEGEEVPEELTTLLNAIGDDTFTEAKYNELDADTKTLLLAYETQSVIETKALLITDPDLLGLPADSTYEQIRAALEQAEAVSLAYYQKRFPSSRTFDFFLNYTNDTTYTKEKLNLYTEAQFVETDEWYNQFGRYSTYEESEGDWIHYQIDCCDDEIIWASNDYEDGVWNKDHTTYTYSSGRYGMSFTASGNKANRTATLAAYGQTPVELEFSGNSAF